ncbi:MULTISPECIES: hypothetical protein [unclassified Streptomyces]|uniref:hypothetical protein n=1 Tax=unclassified Streptomyces TaxID=2593676 RepID=UPI002DDC558F|nr:hypothetical protein [Streptomyces sp. NBC_00151]WRZ39925.1 hypothetical protein OG915_18880 [Streptomyces sp. NBC_00151]
MPPVWLFLMMLGLPGAVAGSWVAFNVRGAADAIEALRQRNLDLNALAAGSFAPPAGSAFAVRFRLYGTVLGIAGIVLVLAGIAELLTGG